MNPADPPSSLPAETSRRDFLKAAACGVLGTAAILAPIGAGIVVLTAPLRQTSSGGLLARLTTLDSLPIGAVPQLFQVMAERTDAWTKHPLTAIGTVFLERVGENEVRAFNASCPHLGCSVEWRAERTGYFCPCHNSTFARDGAINDPKSPAARGLDTLAVEIRNGEVWVTFQNFKAGLHEKIPVA